MVGTGNRELDGVTRFHHHVVADGERWGLGQRQMERDHGVATRCIGQSMRGSVVAFGVCLPVNPSERIAGRLLIDARCRMIDSKKKDTPFVTTLIVYNYTVRERGL